MPTGLDYSHSAHLCALFDIKDGVPKLVHWGIYSTGPAGLTTYQGSHVYLEKHVSRAGSYDEASRDVAQYVVHSAGMGWFPQSFVDECRARG